MSRTAARSVTVIPPTINPLTHISKVAIQKRRVAGYARVSTDSDEQFTSYEAQVDYYTQYIKRNPEWEFVKVYIIPCSFYNPLTSGSNSSIRWTMRTCSLSGGSGKSAFPTLSLFKFFTTAPLTLSQNW